MLQKEQTTNMQTTIKRGIYLVDPKTNEEVCRRDYIKTLYLEGSKEFEIPAGNRRAIVDHLKNRFNHEVPFQIVFQATAGCTRPTMDMNVELIEEAGKKAKAAVAEQIAEGKKAEAVLNSVTKKS